MVDEALCHSLESYLLNVDTLKQDLEELRKKMGSEHGLREEDDPGLVVVDGFIIKYREPVCVNAC